jgi:hypothetical protein
VVWIDRISLLPLSCVLPSCSLMAGTPAPRSFRVCACSDAAAPAWTKLGGDACRASLSAFAAQRLRRDITP